MRKIKIKNLFNKNHITIVKKENCNNSNIYCNLSTCKKEADNFRIPLRKRHKYFEEVTEKCESPLGFYYYKTTKVYNYPQSKTSEVRKLNINLRDTSYELSYYLEYEDNRVGGESRPWNIVQGDSSFSDKWIETLLGEVNKLIDIVKDNKLKPTITNPTYTLSGKSTTYLSDMSIEDLKKQIFLELFGDTRGVRFQTDTEKIVSHGFDLKTSFRKPKQD